MKKFIKGLPWVLFGISILAIGFLTIGINYMKKDAVQQIKNIQAMEEKFQSTRSAYDAQFETLKGDLDTAQAARDVYADQLQTAEDTLVCANKELFKPDYLFDTGMSKALSEFLTNTGSGVLKTASPEILWGGSKSALFTIVMTLDQTDVSHKFIVFHNDAHFAKNRVFSIDKQCWLDG